MMAYGSNAGLTARVMAMVCNAVRSWKLRYASLQVRDSEACQHVGSAMNGARMGTEERGVCVMDMDAKKAGMASASGSGMPMPAEAAAESSWNVVWRDNGASPRASVVRMASRIVLRRGVAKTHEMRV